MKTSLATVVLLIASVLVITVNAQNTKLDFQTSINLSKIGGEDKEEEALSDGSGDFSYPKFESLPYDFQAEIDNHIKITKGFGNDRKKRAGRKILGIGLTVLGAAAIGLGVISNDIEPGLGDTVIYSGSGMVVTGIVVLSLPPGKRQNNLSSKGN